ncbi:uncharacterized protein BP01DRAFT_390571 [Aspergillus saccharolyticus JOP 1030-1]|uniref:RxLR effector protein n=1 Tax=Aspergillus saccharolyticus JOP 1030-1 TaxID=1450539 RepID=A0A318ZHD8_9EURO|nr:hypothetical protein BP01DRAFT_390571 [Aspergillus saccharolyticus JOP 1030-1]PYH46899.1 hypothetical protein BP01DRAFT_390571 [Aspergillus saccharolyticus JOP 1030-1]
MTMPSLRSNASLLGLLMLLYAFSTISLVEAGPVAPQHATNQIASINARVSQNEHLVERFNPADDALDSIQSVTKMKRGDTDSSDDDDDDDDDDDFIEPSVSYSLLGKVSTIIDHLRR